jgi:hypothetical protein
MRMAAADASRFVVVDAEADTDHVARSVVRAVDPLFEPAARDDEPKSSDARIHG